MTKQIRIENACTSDHRVSVFTETQNADGTWVRQPSPIELNHPTAMGFATIWRGQRLVVEEVEQQRTGP